MEDDEDSGLRALEAWEWEGRGSVVCREGEIEGMGNKQRA